MRHVIAILLASGLIVLAGCAAGPGQAPLPSTDAAASVDVTMDDLGATSLTVRPFGDFLISSGDLVWVSGVAPGIVAYDADMTPVFEVETGTVWAALEYGHGYVWSAESTDDVFATSMLRIDPATGETARFAVSMKGIPEESSLAVTDDAVWAIVSPMNLGESSRLVGLGPETGAVVRTVDVGTASVSAVRGGFGSLWLTRPGGMLTRIDPVSGATQAEIEVPAPSTFLAIGPDAVWVMDQRGGVTRIDPSTDAVVTTIEVSPGGIRGGDIAATADAVWVQTSALLGVEIDPATNAVVTTVGPGEGSGSVAITDDGAVWITAHDVERLYRIPAG